MVVLFKRPTVDFHVLQSMQEEPLSFDNYARAIWKWKWLIISGALIAGALAWYLSTRIPPEHRALALVRIGRVWKEPIEDYYVTERIANTQSFLREAANRAGVNPRQLRRSVHTEALLSGPRRARNPVLLQVTATAEKEEDAIRYAGAVAQEIVARHQTIFDDALKPHLDRQRQLEEREKELAAQPSSRELLLRIESELDEVRTNNSLSNSPVTEKTRLLDDPTADPVPRRSSVWSAAVAASAAIVSLSFIAAVSAHFRRPSGTTSDAQNN